MENLAAIYSLILVLFMLAAVVPALVQAIREELFTRAKPVKRAHKDYAKWEAEKLKRCMPGGI